MSPLFPTTLEEWDAQNSEECEAPTKTEIKPEILSIIPVLEEVGAAWCLPSALYCACLHYDISDILQCWGYDSNIATVCVQGFVKQRQEKFHVLSAMGEAGADPKLCRNHKKCTQSRNSLLASEVAHYALQGENVSRTPGTLWFDSLEYLTKEDREIHEDSLCGACQTKSREVFREARRNVWDRLPSLYQLAAWKELESSKAEALSVRVHISVYCILRLQSFPLLNSKQHRELVVALQQCPSQMETRQ